MELTAKEFEILHLMAQNIGRVISRERLYESGVVPCKCSRKIPKNLLN